MNKNDIFYGLETDEQLMLSVEDVIKRTFDWVALAERDGVSITAPAEVKWPIRVLKFRRMDITRFIPILAEKFAEDTLEMLDEEHGDPDGDPTKPSQRMKDAALEFARVVVDEYIPWGCEPTGEVIEVTREMAKEMLK